MKKLCFILPDYNINTGNHFYHHYELLEKLSKKFNIFLIAERSNLPKVNFGKFKRSYVQKFNFLPFRFIESFIVVLMARFLGYRNFYTHYSYIGGVNAGIISRLTGGKSFYWHCEMIWEFKQKALSRIGLLLNLKLAHFLVTGSKGLREGYIKHYGLKKKNIKIMPNWVNLKRFKRKEKEAKIGKKKTILFVHWLSTRKGAHLLIPIMKRLEQIFSASGRSPAGRQLLVIGDGPLKKKILKQVRKNKLEKSIKLLGEIPNKELVSYYNQADLFLMPSLQEGFPRSLIEAMAMGIPYVASNVGAVKEISPSIAQKFIVEPENIKKFAKKIKILLSNKEVYDKFRRQELIRVKRYSLEKVSQRFIKLFE